MVDQTKFAPYRRAAFLKTVDEGDRPLAARLCTLMESAFTLGQIVLYSGFPVAIRDGEWLAGFAMRKRCPMVYCCAEQALRTLGPELAPILAGKGCMEIRPRKDLSIEAVLSIVERLFKVASVSKGSISKADAKARENKAAKPVATRKATPKTTRKR